MRLNKTIHSSSYKSSNFKCSPKIDDLSILSLASVRKLLSVNKQINQNDYHGKKSKFKGFPAYLQEILRRPARYQILTK